MDIKKILDGQPPTLDDYSNFVLLCEILSQEELWIIINNPNINIILKNVAVEQLRQKIYKNNRLSFDEEYLKKISEIIKASK